MIFADDQVVVGQDNDHAEHINKQTNKKQKNIRDGA